MKPEEVAVSLDDLAVAMRQAFFSEVNATSTASVEIAEIARQDGTSSRGEEILETDEQTQLYTYDPLLDGHTRMRLFVLEPGLRDEPIRGRLVPAVIDACESYEALSYAWGAPEKPIEIFLPHNRSMRITQSLSSALLRLRDTRLERRLWIDAICINQEDLSEKASQVQMMGRIYECSQRVLCWLGEDNAKKEGLRAMKLLNRIGRTKISEIGLGGSVQVEELEGLPKRSSKVWLSLFYFFNRPWFRRCWVAQEFAMPPEAALLCGDITVDWREVGYGTCKIIRYSLLHWARPLVVSVEKELAIHAAYLFNNMVELRYFRYVDEYWQMTFMSLRSGDVTIQHLQSRAESDPRLTVLLNDINTAIRLAGPSSIMPMVENALRLCRDGHWKRSGQYDMLSIRLSLPFLLAKMRVMDATDPRDKIFSLLGLADRSVADVLKPSYTESTHEIYTQVARNLLVNGSRADGLIVLEQAQLDPGPGHADDGLPSWVPDWTQKCVESCILANTVFISPRMYQAAKGTQRKILFHDEREIVLTGVCVGEVQSLIHWTAQNPKRSYDRNDPEMFYTSEDGRFLSFDSLIRFLDDTKDDNNGGRSATECDMVEYFSQVDDMIAHRKEPYFLRKPHEINEDVQIQTLIAGFGDSRKAPDANGFSPDYTMAYRETRSRLRQLPTGASCGDHRDSPLADTDRIKSMLNAFVQRWVVIAEHYSVCESTGGIVGMVPRASQPGDELWILLGGDMPFVVRRSHQDGEKYKLIGACYLHGLMDGEALTNSKWAEREICLC